MNPDALGQFLMVVFIPFVPLLAGAVMAVIILLLVIVMFRGFLPPDE